MSMGCQEFWKGHILLYLADENKELRTQRKAEAQVCRCAEAISVEVIRRSAIDRLRDWAGHIRDAHLSSHQSFFEIAFFSLAENVSERLMWADFCLCKTAKHADGLQNLLKSARTSLATRRQSKIVDTVVRKYCTLMNPCMWSSLSPSI